MDDCIVLVTRCPVDVDDKTLYFPLSIFLTRKNEAKTILKTDSITYNIVNSTIGIILFIRSLFLAGYMSQK
jgi:hypothetical protein